VRSRVSALVLKEFIQFRRDWMMTFFILTLPILQLFLMARSTGSRISGLCVAIYDLDQSRTSRRILTALDNREELALCRYPSSLPEAYRLLDRGEATLLVIIPAGLESGLIAPGLAETSGARLISLIADASHSIPASYGLAAAQSAVEAVVWDVVAGAGGGRDALIDVRTTVRFNPSYNVRFFTVSAQVGFIVYQVTLVVASIGLTRERELGTLEQLMVTPLRRLELIIGKAIPPLIVGAGNFLIVLAGAVCGFKIPMRGSPALLFGVTVLFVAVEIGYGLLISSVARTQQQAVLIVFVLAMVDMTFSGYLVPVENLPAALQAVAAVAPFRHYLEVIRAVMLKGVGWDVVWPHAAAMLAMGVLVTTVAVQSLNRRLD
jgi:ABC-2 type transport system permease protein